MKNLEVFSQVILMYAIGMLHYKS